VNESGQLGTYWVHAHANVGLTDGLRAPLILRPETEVHANDYDEEFSVILADWYHDEAPELLKEFISIANPGGAEPVPRGFDSTHPHSRILISDTNNHAQKPRLFTLPRTEYRWATVSLTNHGRSNREMIPRKEHVLTKGDRHPWPLCQSHLPR
jgi:FtsP/CotA-like multicopper oxidase with cupredoxin domain